MRAHLRRPAAILLLLGALFLLVPIGPAAATGGQAAATGGQAGTAAAGRSAAIPAADPSPSLGASQTPAPSLAGDNDGDAADYSQLVLVLLIPLAVIAIVGAATLVWFRGRRRERDARDEQGTPDQQ
jgi:hypothetical protein